MMKNLCRKERARVRPSVSSCRDACSVLRLLPVAVAALCAALPPEDQEVLAYLISRSPDFPSEGDVKKHRKGRRNGKETLAEGVNSAKDVEEPPWLPETSCGLKTDFSKLRGSSGLLSSSGLLGSHSPSFECGCFQCYTSFWSRWNASPSREIIHEAIDLFEEITATENAGKAKNRGVKGCGSVESEVCLSGSSEKEAEPEEAPKPSPTAKQIVPFVPLEFELEDEDRESDQQSSSAVSGTCPPSLMRRMFPRLMGFVDSHLRTAWRSPQRPSTG
eukprot:TRINITY_DN5048_c0_g1_i1.p1 TRINITY_DN5048_c0_g1~~TRINITY_DN5048_c0_g1_i1.p1  ORF type:complete len:275 (+),score=27.58 TRINITY_DN5048_c0_g1_i1:188-1012(+)